MNRDEIARMLEPLHIACEPDNEANQLFHRDVLLMEYDRLTAERDAAIKQLGDDARKYAGEKLELESKLRDALTERDNARLETAGREQVVQGQQDYIQQLKAKQKEDWRQMEKLDAENASLKQIVETTNALRDNDRTDHAQEKFELENRVASAVRLRDALKEDFANTIFERDSIQSDLDFARKVQRVLAQTLWNTLGASDLAIQKTEHVGSCSHKEDLGERNRIIAAAEKRAREGV